MRGRGRCRSAWLVAVRPISAVINVYCRILVGTDGQHALCRQRATRPCAPPPSNVDARRSNPLAAKGVDVACHGPHHREGPVGATLGGYGLLKCKSKTHYSTSYCSRSQRTYAVL